MRGVQVSLPADVQRRIQSLEAEVRGLQQMKVGTQIPLDKKAKDQSFWDTEYLQAGVGRQTVQYFQSQVFGAGPQLGGQKSRTEFNLRTEGTFATPKEYTIYGLKVRVMSGIEDGLSVGPRTMEMIRSYAVISYRQGQRDIFTFRLDDFSAPGFVGGANAAAAGGFLNFGAPGLTDWKPFSITLPIKAGLRFGWVIETAPEFDIEEDARIQLEMVGQLVDNLR